jgi:hypothetical protein
MDIGVLAVSYPVHLENLAAGEFGVTTERLTIEEDSDSFRVRGLASRCARHPGNTERAEENEEGDKEPTRRDLLHSRFQ